MAINDEKEEELHKKHEALTEVIYNTPDMLPNRYVYILTNLCNLSCDFCFMDRKYNPKNLKTEDWINVSKQLPDYARVTMTGGEPLMFKGFKDVFSYVAKRFDCNLITNGLLLTEDLCDFMLSYPKFRILSISVDSVGNNVRDVDPVQWKRTEEMMKYFKEQKNNAGSSAGLDIKTTILDENAEELFDIHRYCVEELGCDYHVFQFLKGSPIQHSDVMFKFEDILKESKAQIYERFETIKQQFKKIQQYNIEHGNVSFLHPKVGSLMDEDNFPMMDYMNVLGFVKENYMSCKYPWSSVHINSDGNLFTCLAVPMGNVKEKSLVEIINGEEMAKFRNLIKSEGTIEACNRCGWLKPKIR